MSEMGIDEDRTVTLMLPYELRKQDLVLDSVEPSWARSVRRRSRHGLSAERRYGG
jgi:hypothetical protein